MSTNSRYSASVIVPVYNGKQHIENCIKSLINQNYPKDKLEIIIVDNGSTDGTQEIASKFDVRVIHCAIKGPSAARNMGAEHAEGEILIFIDSDCIADSNLIGAHVENHERNKRNGGNLALVGGSITGIVTNFWSLFDDYCCWTATHPNLKAKKINQYWPTANISIPKRLFLEVGKFNADLMNAEDVEFCLRIRRRRYEIYFEPLAKVLHQNRDTPKGVFKRIVNWASVNEDHIKLGIVGRPNIPILLEAVAGGFIIVAEQFYYSFLVRRFSIFLFLPLLLVNAGIFSYQWAKAQYSFRQ